MHDPKVRAMVSTKLRAMGWKPTVRGGNGKPLPPEHIAIAAMLGWKTEVAIATKSRHLGLGLPTCYKLDIAHEGLKIALEIDGNSHNVTVRKEQDAKKDAFLAGLGWKVLRVSKKEAQQNPQAIVSRVLSII
ncbi:DUF559 domain-containing protein [Verrucomicrobium sp. BvORR106]|uniref:endonuclease domain-containing protein n=1 Tax=Verrucomicrobium sp. BvORR106 TaxID=1403819 RepID=UPI0005716DAA|nr:DUF559 domain-containing protein [Verrucomicrobium sp. BvORR106]